jgi:hypothetical protein
VVEGADMLNGLGDWSRVEEHLRSGWRSIKTRAPRKGEQPPKWHLSTRKTSGEEMHLDVCKSTGIETSEITSEIKIARKNFSKVGAGKLLITKENCCAIYYTLA